MTKLERELIAIIKEHAWGLTQAELVGYYVERHLGPALVKIQKEHRVTTLTSGRGYLVAPIVKR